MTQMRQSTKKKSCHNATLPNTDHYLLTPLTPHVTLPLLGVETDGKEHVATLTHGEGEEVVAYCEERPEDPIHPSYKGEYIPC